MLVKVLNYLASRARKDPISTIVLHATAGASWKSSYDWLKQIGLSYHYGVERDGIVYKAVPTTRVAYHAGESFGPNGSNVNNYSIGVSFANRDDGKEEITKDQYKAAAELCVELIVANPSIKYITTHAIIAPKRKVDPRGPVAGIKWSGKFPLDDFVKVVNGMLIAKGKKTVSVWRG